MTTQRTRRPQTPDTEGAQRWIERVEEQRDLRSQIETVLAPEESQEFQFYEWSPGRTYVTLWSMEDGTEVTLPRYMAQQALYLVGTGGKPRFTAQQSKAPKARQNTVKCFLHRDSPERPLLDEIGIGGACPAETLANESAKLQHARSRHRQEYQQYRDELDRRENATYRAEQRAYMEAIQNLAMKSGK